MDKMDNSIFYQW